MKRVRHHVILVLPPENIRVCSVKSFVQDHAAIGPGQPIIAGRDTDDAVICRGVQCFEKHVPNVVVEDHKWIGDVTCRNISNISGGKDGIHDVRGRSEIVWRVAGVDAYRPFRCAMRDTRQNLEEQDDDQEIEFGPAGAGVVNSSQSSVLVLIIRDINGGAGAASFDNFEPPNALWRISSVVRI